MQRTTEDEWWRKMSLVVLLVSDVVYGLVCDCGGKISFKLELDFH